MPLEMPLLFAATPALVPCPSASSLDVIVTLALVPCPSAPTLACRCCRRRHLSLASQRPCLTSSSRRLSSLARQHPPLHRCCRHQLTSLARQHPCLPSSLRRLLSLARQRPPLPAIVVASGTCPLPVSVLTCHCRCTGSCPLPVSILACRCHRAGSHPLSVSVCPCLPLLPRPPPMAVDAPGKLLPSAATLAVLPPPLSSLQPPSSSAATIIIATKPSLPPPPPPPNLVLFWVKYLFSYRGIITPGSKKQKSS